MFSLLYKPFTKHEQGLIPYNELGKITILLKPTILPYKPTTTSTTRSVEMKQKINIPANKSKVDENNFVFVFVIDKNIK